MSHSMTQRWMVIQCVLSGSNYFGLLEANIQQHRQKATDTRLILQGSTPNPKTTRISQRTTEPAWGNCLRSKNLFLKGKTSAGVIITQRFKRVMREFCVDAVNLPQEPTRAIQHCENTQRKARLCGYNYRARTMTL